jgi:CheY-like chemotaxis protein
MASIPDSTARVWSAVPRDVGVVHGGGPDQAHASAPGRLSDIAHAGISAGASPSAVARTRTRTLARARSGADVTVLPGWVLVVVDDAGEGLSIFRLVERAGHHATVAGDGGSALALLREEPFDVVLLDVGLADPDHDGSGVVGAITGEAGRRHIPVIAMSRNDDGDDAGRAIELGAHARLPKPIDAGLLRARVEAAITTSRLRQAEAGRADPLGHLAPVLAANGERPLDP